MHVDRSRSNWKGYIHNLNKLEEENYLLCKTAKTSTLCKIHWDARILEKINTHLKHEIKVFPSTKEETLVTLDNVPLGIDYKYHEEICTMLRNDARMWDDLLGNIPSTEQFLDLVVKTRRVKYALYREGPETQDLDQAQVGNNSMQKWSNWPNGRGQLLSYMYRAKTESYDVVLIIDRSMLYPSRIFIQHGEWTSMQTRLVKGEGSLSLTRTPDIGKCICKDKTTTRWHWSATSIVSSILECFSGQLTPQNLFSPY